MYDIEELSIEPKNLRWTGDGGYQTVQLRNITTDRLAVKVRQYYLPLYITDN